MTDKPIDMSAFVGRDFDCEFSQSPLFQKGIFEIGRLISHNDAGLSYLRQEDAYSYDYCRPRLNHWHFNDGSMVLPNGLVVDCCDYEGVSASFTMKSDDIANRLKWELEDVWLYEGGVESYLSAGTIIAVKILGLQKGYELEGLEVVE